MSKLSVEIGKRIRNYRIQGKMSQEELAEKCGLHPAYIGQLERGEKNATIESISKISAGLSISMSILFEKLDDYEKPQTNYPTVAYDLVQSVPEKTQEKLISILKMAIDIK